MKKVLLLLLLILSIALLAWPPVDGEQKSITMSTKLRNGNHTSQAKIDTFLIHTCDSVADTLTIGTLFINIGNNKTKSEGQIFVHCYRTFDIDTTIDTTITVVDSVTSDTLVDTTSTHVYDTFAVAGACTQNQSLKDVFIQTQTYQFIYNTGKALSLNDSIFMAIEREAFTTDMNLLGDIKYSLPGTRIDIVITE